MSIPSLSAHAVRRRSQSFLTRLLHAAFLLYLLAPSRLSAQPPASGTSDDELRFVFVIARHGVRAPIESETRQSRFNAEPWPSWPVAPGLVTPHGTAALRLLGDYYRARYPALLEHSTCSQRGLYVEANTVPRTIASAKAMLSGLSPDCPIEVHTRSGRNPLFGPAETSAVDHKQLNAAILGRMGDHPDWYAAAYKRQLAKMHQVLTGCPGAACSASALDLRSAPPPAAAAPYESSVTLAADFAENLLLQYTEGFPLKQVGWGRASRADLDDLMELNTRYHDFMLRTPLYAAIAASNLAAHLRDTLTAAAEGKPKPLQLGSLSDRFILLDGHDANLTWLGGLLRLDWALPDQTINATPPGSALVFELHRDRGTGTQTVRVLFLSQSLDQMRSLRPLTPQDPPGVAPIFVPGCSDSAPGFPCTLQDFTDVLTRALDTRFVEASVRQAR